MSEARTPEVVEETSALVAQQNAGIVRAAPGDVTLAFDEYRKIQATLDRAMPDSIMTIQGKPFRKKSYWRAIATAFNLNLQSQHESRIAEGTDWGYTVTYRATAPNGRYADGDGTCMASEKSGRMVTVHNVRAHAHTRAMNRAISNLVGFGEVSAEEMRDERGYGDRAEAPLRPRESPAAERPTRMTASPSLAPPSGPLASDKQVGKIWGDAKRKAAELGISEKLAEQQMRMMLEGLGYESSKEIHAARVDYILGAIRSWTLGDFGDDEPPPAESPF